MPLLNEGRRPLLDAMKERSLDTVLGLVADRDRRQAIQHLRHEADGDTSVDDLVDAVADGRSDGNDQTTHPERLAIQLYHTHLPKLAEYGVVEFDPGRRAVRYRADEQVERVLDSLSDELPLAHP